MTMENEKDFIVCDYENCLAVRVQNEDMKGAYIPCGAVAVVHKQRTANNGDIVLVAHNSKQDFRYYHKNGETEYLAAANGTIPPVIIGESDDFIILGKVIEIRIEL